MDVKEIKKEEKRDLQFKIILCLADNELKT